jgi:dCMP deaminase
MKWEKRYLDLCLSISSWSKDPSTKIGCLIVGRDGQILSQGYNGFPRYIKDDANRYEDRETKYKFVVHAECNAIYNASKIGARLDGSTMYVTGLPVCTECAKAIVQSGIRKLICSFPGVKKNWEESCSFAQEILEEAGVDYLIMDPLSSKLSKLSIQKLINEK